MSKIILLRIHLSIIRGMDGEQNSVSTETYLTSVKVKVSRYRPGVAQRVGRGIALLFHDHGTRRG